VTRASSTLHAALRRPPLVTAVRLSHELWDAWRFGGTLAARCRLGADALTTRLMKLPIGAKLRTNRQRSVRLRNGMVLHYRCNSGDIQSIREVWFEEIYRLPRRDRVAVAVDLGANIGMTSLWLHDTFAPDTIVAVEPSRSNADLARRNFEANGVPVHLIEAAVGSQDGMVRFSEGEGSNLGAVAEVGDPVPMVSMATVLGTLPADTTIDLLKIDIEGGETDLLSGDAAWLDSVRIILIEFHPPAVEVDVLIDLLRARGFSYLPCAELFPESVDLFFKDGELDVAALSGLAIQAAI
jgi:FkbM family methyltransferase